MRGAARSLSAGFGADARITYVAARPASEVALAGLGRLCEAIADDDEPAVEAVLDDVVDELDTPLERLG